MFNTAAAIAGVGRNGVRTSGVSRVRSWTAQHGAATTVGSDTRRHNSAHTGTTTTTTTLYTMGAGWTGALGTGSLATEQAAPLSWRLSHDDDDDDDDGAFDPHFARSGLHVPPGIPGVVSRAVCGWGHSAVLASQDDGTNALYVSGRPHDLAAVLRLQRLPTFLRDTAVRLSALYNDDLFADARDVRRDCILSEFREVPLGHHDQDDGDTPVDVMASAGLTLILGASGTLYALGLNQHGQCGVPSSRDAYHDNNVWTPTPVRGLRSGYHGGNRAELEGGIVTDAAVGLQHALAVDEEGVAYSWGKGTRGQLGHGTDACESLPAAKPIPIDKEVGKVAAGFNRSACVTKDGREVWVWGKNVTFGDDGTSVQDAPAPLLLQGLPPSLQVRDVCCGSHHTSVLLEDGSVWAVGIATDNTEPLLDEAVRTLAPDPNFNDPTFFAASFDSTTIISNDGTDVREISLWSHEDLRENGDVVPDCVRYLQDKHAGSGGDPLRFKSLSRGWKHSMLVTEENIK